MRQHRIDGRERTDLPGGCARGLGSAEIAQGSSHDPIGGRRLADADLAEAVPTLSIEQLTPIVGAHTRPETLLPGSFDLAVSPRVVHRLLL